MTISMTITSMDELVKIDNISRCRQIHFVRTLRLKVVSQFLSIRSCIRQRVCYVTCHDICIRVNIYYLFRKYYQASL